MIRPLRSISQGEVADHYDDLDTFYRDVWGEHLLHGLWRTGRESIQEAVRQLVRHLAEKVGVERGMHVVDVGSGYGATARQLTAELGARVTAITVSPAQHEYARGVATGGESQVRYVLGDWNSNLFPDESFDRAIAIESTEHMADKAAAFRHLRRVLVPGGTVGICAWIAADRPAEWMVRRLLEPICREGRLPGLGTEADYRALLEESGFRIDAVDDLSPLVAATWSRSVRGVAGRIARDRRYRSYLLDRNSRNREFAITLVRILLAYRAGAMRYLMFVARRPAP